METDAGQREAKADDCAPALPVIRGAANGPVDRELIQAATAKFESELATATDLEHLRRLDDQASIVKEMLRRMDAAFEAQSRFAELEVRCARKLGEILRAQGHRGGRGSNSHRDSSIRGGSSSPLPEWLNWSRSARCQRLAAIPEPEFDRLIRDSKERHRIITQASLLRSMCPSPKRQPKQRVRNAGCLDGLERVWEAVQRVMDVDLAVGVPQGRLHAQRQVDAGAEILSLEGGVVVAAVGDEERWICRAVAERSRGHLAQAVLLMRASTADPWFGLLGKAPWSCCFLPSLGREAPLVVAYLGHRWSAFHVVMAEVGTVMRGT